jgi:hypothetical protein
MSGEIQMKNDPESVRGERLRAWRDKMTGGLHHDPKAETITPVSESHARPVRYEEVPVDPAERLISVQRQAADHLASIDKSVATIKHVLVFFLALTIIGTIIGLIAAVTR